VSTAVDGLVPIRAVDPLRLAHAVANGLAAAELHLFTIAAGCSRQVAFDFDDEFGVGEAQAVTRGGAEHLGVGASLNTCHVVLVNSRLARRRLLV